MTDSLHRDPYRRVLRPWSDPLVHAPPVDSPYPVAPPDEEPIVAELVDPAPPRLAIDPFEGTSQPTPRIGEATPFRFSLLELMMLMTVAAVLFALMGSLPGPVFAGAAGGLSLLMLIILSFVENSHPLLKMGWWLLFAVYLVASLTAAIGG